MCVLICSKFLIALIGRPADGLASTLACTIAASIATNASVNFRMYVPQRPSKVPIAPPRWEFLLTCPIESHLSIRIHIWFYQGNVRANQACKLPNAPIGKLLTCLLRLTRCTTANASVNYSWCVPQRLQKFPSPRWDFHMSRAFHMVCACACRAAVCASTVAR